MSEQDWTSASAPGATPKINSIFDFSAEALGQLKVWLEQAGMNLPISNIIGFSKFTAKFASEASEAHRNVAGYGDPNVSGVAGPTISGLPNGSYVVTFGGSGTGTAASNVVAYMAVSVNGSTPVDADSCEAQGTGHYSTSRSILVSLTAGSNELKALYKTSDGTDRGDFRYRWMVAQRYANT